MWCGSSPNPAGSRLGGYWQEEEEGDEEGEVEEGEEEEGVGRGERRRRGRMGRRSRSRRRARRRLPAGAIFPPRPSATAAARAFRR